MKRKTPASQTEWNILKSARSALRGVTITEKIASKGRFSLGGEYIVPKTIKKVGARTAYVTVSRFKDFVAGISHGAATALRKTGLLPYKSAAAEEQAAKSRATKATLPSKIERVKKAKRNARRHKAASKEGFERGRKQRERVFEYLNEKYAQHERYLKTGRADLALEEDEYRKVIHLMFEYHGDDARMERMQQSPEVTALAP